MKERDHSLMAIIFLALAGVFAVPFAGLREAPPVPAPAVLPSQTPAAHPGPAPLHDVAGPLLAEAFSLEPTEKCPRPFETGAVLTAIREKHKDVVISALVVTVPDPVDSILDYAFDRSLDALQRALRVDGFLLDRYVLPWFDGTPRSGRSGPGEAGPPERSPGVLLFRAVKPGRPPMSHLLVVFLVGETPISGLQKPALARALTEALTITRYGAGLAPPEPGLRVLGPFFSGSARSLRLALRQWAVGREPKDPLKVSIVSGSATVSWIKKVLDFEDRDLQLSVSFSATVIPDQITRKCLYGYLQDLGVNLDRVALLTESNTAYGQSWGAQGGLPGPGVTIVFPMHISQLRAAYEKDKLLQPLSESKGPAAGARTLDITLEDSAKRRDAIPSVSDLSTHSDESSLAAILATLSRLRVQYVGIVATDVRDKLFLARQISLNCPGVTLFTLDSDILLAHPKYLPFLRGMLVASSYPLYSQNQIWTPDASPHELFQFPSGAAQGLFNATLVLLNKDKALVEYGPPFPQLVPDGRNATRHRRPPVWLTVIGNTSAWPLDAFNLYWDQDKFLYIRKDDPLPPAAALSAVLGDTDWRLAASRLSRFFLGGLCLLSLGMSAAFAFANHKPRRQADEATLQQPRADEEERPPDNSTLARLKLDSDKRAPYRKDLLLLLLFSPLLVVQILATSAFLQPYRLALRDGSATLLSLPAGALLSLAGVLFSLLVLTSTTARIFYMSIRREGLLFRRRPLRLADLSRFPRLFRPEGDVFLRARLRGTFEALSGGALILLLLAAIFLTFYDAVPKDLLAALLLFERLTNPVSGLSILVPLVLLAGACASLAFCHLRRLTLDEGGGFRASLGGRRLSELCGAERIERQIRRTLRQIWVSPVLSALLTVVFGALVAWLLSHVTPTPEREPYHTIFRLAFFFGCLGALFTAARYLLLWRHLRTLLRLLASHPVADAFDRVPHRFAEAVGPRAFGRFFLLPDFARLLHLWNLLEIDFAAARPGIQRVLNLEDDEATKVLTALSKIRNVSSVFSGGMRRLGDRLVPTWRARVRTAEAITSAANIVQRVLEPYWRTKPPPTEEAPRVRDGATPAPEEPADRRALDPAAAAWLRRAEEFLAGHVVVYVAYVFLHLRNLLSTYIISALLLFFAITAYPFQPARFLVFFVFTLVVLFAVLTVVTFIHMDRDEILSRISRTRTGKVSWDFAFVAKLLVYAVLPILSVVGASIPQVQTGLSSAIDSLSRVIK